MRGVVRGIRRGAFEVTAATAGVAGVAGRYHRPWKPGIRYFAESPPVPSGFAGASARRRRLDTVSGDNVFEGGLIPDLRRAIPRVEPPTTLVHGDAMAHPAVPTQHAISRRRSRAGALPGGARDQALWRRPERLALLAAAGKKSKPKPAVHGGRVSPWTACRQPSP